MEKNTLAKLLLALFLTSMLTLAFNVQQIKPLEAPTATEWAKTYEGSYDAYSRAADKSGYSRASVQVNATTGATSVNLALEPDPDFSITALPTSTTMLQESRHVSIITITSINGFSQTVNLTVSGAPTGVNATLSPTSVTLYSGGSATSILSINVSASTVPGMYTLTVAGTSSTLSHSVDIDLTVISVVVPDFGISASPNSLTMLPGSAENSTITITSLEGFSSAVTLSFSGAPEGVTHSGFQPHTITPLSGGTAVSNFMINVETSTAPGTYTLTVTGTSGQLTHSTTITLVVTSVNVIKACVEFKPEKLNLKSKGRWITCFIKLPKGYNASNIDVSSIMLNGTIPAGSKFKIIRDCDGDRVIGLIVKFNRTQVEQFILNSTQVKGKWTTVTLTVTGSLKDGTQFQGADRIKVIEPIPHQHHHKCHHNEHQRVCDDQRRRPE
jgi:hypothetical protein